MRAGQAHAGRARVQPRGVPRARKPNASRNRLSTKGTYGRGGVRRCNARCADDLFRIPADPPDGRVPRPPSPALSGDRLGRVSLPKQQRHYPDEPMFITTRNQNGPVPLLALTKGVSDTSPSRRGSAVRVVTDQSARTRDDGACSVGDETTQGVDQPGRCVRADRLRDAERVQGIELARESVRVARHGDRPESLETACSSALVLVAVLAER